eukprot:CAMPEP_0175762154 /NCGR_PEP_ID=MMETSP0097-20121207/67045_1 /TAXON_ID=311494 /ORGANISM="Alexandrium monilatum, Strain CCMP3105" /LENGTH=42 /DNA_ID= /DNA_START= /DNA_END= /DNA_ORIENTATION=
MARTPAQALERRPGRANAALAGGGPRPCAPPPPLRKGRRPAA